MNQDSAQNIQSDEESKVASWNAKYKLKQLQVVPQLIVESNSSLLRCSIFTFFAFVQKKSRTNGGARMSLDESLLI